MRFGKALVSAIVISPLWFVSMPAQAVSNGSFEAGLTGWSSFGDVTTLNLIGGQIASGTLMAALSTANDPDDDFPGPSLRISANPAIDIGALESALGVNAYAFDPDNASGIGAMEGSAITQSFAVQAGDSLSFRWNFISNDLSSSLGIGGFDAAYFVVTQGTSTTVSRLGDLSGALGAPASGNYLVTSGDQTYQYTFQQSGTASIGFVVVDSVDFSVSSVLALDQVILTPVPEAPLWAMLFGGLGIVAFGKRRLA